MIIIYKLCLSKYLVTFVVVVDVFSSALKIAMAC